MGRLERHCNCLQLQGGHVEEEARVIGCKLQEGRIWQCVRKEFLITVSSQCRRTSEFPVQEMLGEDSLQGAYSFTQQVFTGYLLSARLLLGSRTQQ